MRFGSSKGATNHPYEHPAGKKHQNHRPGQNEGYAREIIPIVEPGISQNVQPGKQEEATCRKKKQVPDQDRH
jgi:hypothetical protein